MKSYSNVVRAVLTRPWAIDRDSVQWAVITDVLAHRLAGDPFSDEEIASRLAAVPPRPAAAAAASEQAGPVIAVLPIHGVLMPRADLMSEMSGATSVASLSSAFGEAIDDDRVAAVLLHVDSPGGLVDGIPEFAAQIRESRGKKPIAAVVDTVGASAAYWLATQAEELSVTPSGEVGSIGVFSAHEDASKFWDTLGVKTTLISAGKYKVEGNEFEPLADEARDHIQAIINDFYGMFVNDVAKGRGIKAADVRNGYGQGRVLTASMAKAEGMVDRVETFGQAMERLGRRVRPARGRSALAAVHGTTVAIGDHEHEVTAGDLAPDDPSGWLVPEELEVEANPTTSSIDLELMELDARRTARERRRRRG